MSGSVNLALPDGQTEDLLAIPESRLRQLRWRHIAYIPQGSMSALNPVLKSATDDRHPGRPRHDDERGARSVAQSAGIYQPDPSVLDRYPHELSGGMMQRVAIAAAVSMGPSLLIADEPTTALDVVTQRLILQELERIRQELGTTIIVITHDMGVIAQVVDRMAVMYAGRIVESGPVRRRVRCSPASVRLRPDPGHPKVRRPAGVESGRRDSQPVRLPGRLPVPPALPARHGSVPPADAGASRGEARPSGRLPSVRRRRNCP